MAPANGLQQTLDLRPFRVPELAVGATHRERWAAISADNPWILPHFAGLADALMASGIVVRLTGKLIGELYRCAPVRWVPGGGEFKWNNNYTAGMAADLAVLRPDLGALMGIEPDAEVVA